MLTGKEYIRYSRQIMLDKHGEQGQENLKASTALIIGLGGLGCPTSQYLAAAGVGHLILVDDDDIELTNLHRQILFANAQVGEKKVLAAAERLSALNPHIKITTKQERACLQNLPELAAEADVILDCSDNIETRYAINNAAFKLKKKLVIGSAIRYEGQVISFNFSQSNSGSSASSGCYQCLVPNPDDDSFNCSTSGVIGPLLGIIGSMQALSAIKAITGEGFVHNQWQCFDGMTQQWLSINHSGDSNCSLCSGSISK